MELRHLRYFLAVAQTCHFGRAAKQLHIAQSALSHAIRQLESELGAALFTRTTRQVRLTPAGEFFVLEAQRLLGGLDDSVRAVRRIADGSLGVVRVAFTGTAAFSHLPSIARTVKRELPGVSLEIHSDLLTPAQCDGLREGQFDIGVLRPPAQGEGIRLHTIEVEPLVLAVPADHRLAVEPVVSVADLRAEDFIVYAGKDSTVNDAVLRSCRAAGFSPRRELEASGTGVLLALVAGRLGIGVVPASARALPLADVVFRDLLDAESVELALAWRHGDDSPVVRSVVDTLASTFPAPPSPSGAST